MSFDKSAVEKIQNSASVKEVQDVLDKAGTAVPLAAHPHNCAGLLNLEKYMPNAVFFRQEFKTESLKDFQGYVKKFDAVGAMCFVDGESMSAKAVFDRGTLDAPGHQHHLAHLGLKKTAAYRAFLNIIDQRLSQQDAADFLEDWSDNVICIDNDGEQMEWAHAANALRDVTIEQARSSTSKVGDMANSDSIAESVEAKMGSKYPVTVDFECFPYAGLDEFHFPVKIQIVGKDKPQIIFRAQRLEAIQEKIVESFKAVLLEGFEDLQVDTYIGSQR